jgi:uncharacterized protein YqgC (DUF456 family)
MDSGIIASVAAVAGWILFGITILAGIALNVVGLFGNWIILAAIALAWMATGFDHWGVWSIASLAALAFLGEVLETLSAGYGAAKFGGGRGAIVSALIGGIAGAMFGTPVLPVLGTLAGACIGAFIGATLHEALLMRRKAGPAAWTGFGAAMGRMGGVLAKLLIGLVMLLVAFMTF